MAEIEQATSAPGEKRNTPHRLAFRRDSTGLRLVAVNGPVAVRSVRVEDDEAEIVLIVAADDYEVRSS